MSFLRTWSYYIDIWLFDRESYIFFFLLFGNFNRNFQVQLTTKLHNEKTTSLYCNFKRHSDVYLRILFSYTDIYWRWNRTKRRFYQNWIMFWKTSHTFQSFLCWCQFSHIDSRLECRMPLMTNYQAKYMCVCGNSKTFLKREKVIFFLNKMRATRKPNLMSLSIKSHFFCPY